METTVNNNPMTTTVEQQPSQTLESFRESILFTLLAVFGFVFFVTGASLLAIPALGQIIPSSPSINYAFSGILLSFLGILCGLLYVIKRDSYNFNSGALIALIAIAGTYFLFTNWLVVGILILLMAIFVSSILFTLQISIVILMLAQMLVTAVLTWISFSTPAEVSILNLSAAVPWTVLFIQISLVTTLLYILGMVLLNSNNQAIHKQEILKQQLEDQQKMLEQRVNEHTRSLDVTQEVNRLISTILDANRLLGDVVEKIRNAFDYYHVQIYLFQPETNSLKIAGATGEAGTALLIGEHQMPMNIGIVGKAASQNESLIIDRVIDSEDWVPNSLLPDTAAEIAVPIIWDNQVLGVLDVQQNKPFKSPKQDIEVLQTIALQLGTAISNVTVFQQAEEQLNREFILNEMALKLQVAPDIESGMQVVGRHVAKILDPVSVKVSIDPALLEEVETS